MKNLTENNLRKLGFVNVTKCEKHIRLFGPEGYKHVFTGYNCYVYPSRESTEFKHLWWIKPFKSESSLDHADMIEDVPSLLGAITRINYKHGKEVGRKSLQSQIRSIIGVE